MNNLGDTIKACRTRRDMTQEALAETSDLSIGSVSLIERGLREPSLPALSRIAEAFDISAWVLLYMADDSGEGWEEHVPPTN